MCTYDNNSVVFVLRYVIVCDKDLPVGCKASLSHTDLSITQVFLYKVGVQIVIRTVAAHQVRRGGRQMMMMQHRTGGHRKLVRIACTHMSVCIASSRYLSESFLSWRVQTVGT